MLSLVLPSNSGDVNLEYPVVYVFLQVWLHAPYELHLSLFEHFIELLTESRYPSALSWLAGQL